MKRAGASVFSHHNCMARNVALRWSRASPVSSRHGRDDNNTRRNRTKKKTGMVRSEGMDGGGGRFCGFGRAGLRLPWTTLSWTSSDVGFVTIGWIERVRCIIRRRKWTPNRRRRRRRRQSFRFVAVVVFFAFYFYFCFF